MDQNENNLFDSQFLKKLDKTENNLFSMTNVLFGQIDFLVEIYIFYFLHFDKSRNISSL